MNTTTMLQGNNILLVVSQADLKEMFLSWVEDWRKENQPEIKETYLTREEVCDLLNISKPSLWRWKNKGLLIPVKVGNRPLYRQSDIDKLMKNEG